MNQYSLILSKSAVPVDINHGLDSRDVRVTFATKRGLVLDGAPYAVVDENTISIPNVPEDDISVIISKSE